MPNEDDWCRLQLDFSILPVSASDLFSGSIRKQLDAFLTGFYEVIPKQLISMFNEQELELLISGLPDVDIDDLANNTEYKMYTKTSAQVGVYRLILLRQWRSLFLCWLC